MGSSRFSEMSGFQGKMKLESRSTMYLPFELADFQCQVCFRVFYLDLGPSEVDYLKPLDKLV